MIVLGVGTVKTPAGGEQLGLAGDRVVLGARLYRRGLARRLVTTGQSFTASGPSPAEQTTAIWRDLGVPSSDILQLGGRSTQEEMLAIAQLIEQEDWQRVGLVTSAWHMPRAMRLAGEQSLSLTPLPADFRQDYELWAAVILVPDATSLQKTSIAMKEFLAGLVGR